MNNIEVPPASNELSEAEYVIIEDEHEKEMPELYEIDKNNLELMHQYYDAISQYNGIGINMVPSDITGIMDRNAFYAQGYHPHYSYDEYLDDISSMLR